jgi:2,4-dienoyl-CoA reductase-like NADH-dependent reductase (Old Yellow Enzyme family)
MGKMLFQPIEIKSMRLKNRIGLAPMANHPMGPNGTVNDLAIRWYEERAKGGAGFIMTGAYVVSPSVPALLERMPLQASAVTLRNDEHVAGFTRLTNVIHSYDCMLGIQIVALGPMSGQGPSPSPFPDETRGKFGLRDISEGKFAHVEVTTLEDIHRFTRDLAEASARAREAGFDCVELHLAHTVANLVSSFVSPYFNRRTDEYGGSWENRLRFPIETIRAMRQAVGDDFPILVRLSSDELLGHLGITLEDTVNIIIPALEEASVDCFDVSQGAMTHSGQGITIPLYYERGCFIHNAAAVKKVTDKPVIGVGAIFDLDMAEKFLQEGKADIIFSSRQLTADPETPKKYYEGQLEDIRKCIGCLGGCGRPCTINYDIQDEPIPLTPAEHKKRVLVVGGGIAGMEAARIASLRGHEVTLIEKSAQLGGAVADLSLDPLLSEFGNLVEYLSNQMRRLGAFVRVCKEATSSDIEAIGPDAVILATGSSEQIPEVAQDKLGVLTHLQALREPKAVGQKVVIWGIFGAELGISLADKRKDVTILAMSGEGSLGSDMAGVRRFWLLRKLSDLNLPRETTEAQRLTNPRILYHIVVDGIDLQGIRAHDDQGREHLLPFDSLILSQRFGERKVNDELFDQLQGRVSEVYKIGDCQQVRGIREAIWDANEVARKL